VIGGIILITGSLQIKKRKKGEIYYAVLNLGKNKYKWINLNLEVKNNKKTAQRKLNELISEYSNSADDSTRILFTDYIAEWLEREKEQVDTVTLEGYQQFANKHIIPYFKNLNLNIQDVTIKHLEDYYNYKSKNGRLDKKTGGLSNRSIKLHSITINLIFKDALYRNIIQLNPNERAKIPKNKDINFKGSFYTIEQINELLKLFNNTLMHDMVYITCLYGLRRSELMGLRWSAVDFENEILTIKHTVVLKETVVIKDKTKNESSNRCYPLLPEIKEMFLRIKEKQESNKRLFGNCYKDTGYVFTRENGDMFHPSYTSHRLRKIVGKSDLPLLRWHDLRHSCASLLFALGWSMKDVSEWLGHSNISTTMNIYTHIDVNRKRDLSKGLSGLLAK